MIISRSPEETEALGRQWGETAEPGWVIGLDGDLGAGKTQLARGLAAGIGSRDRVHSPTFTLLHEYTGGRLPLYHLDLYRLETPEAVVAAGLEEYLFQDTGVTVVEWISRWLGDGEFPQGGPRTRKVRIDVMDEQTRRITYEDFGA